MGAPASSITSPPDGKFERSHATKAERSASGPLCAAGVGAAAASGGATPATAGEAPLGERAPQHAAHPAMPKIPQRIGFFTIRSTTALPNLVDHIARCLGNFLPATSYGCIYRCVSQNARWTNDGDRTAFDDESRTSTPSTPNVGQAASP